MYKFIEAVLQLPCRSSPSKCTSWSVCKFWYQI